MTSPQADVEIPGIGTQLESKPLPSLSDEGVATGFDGLDDTDNSLPTEPPDTQAAVGPNHIVEMTNSMGRVTTKSGQFLVNFSLRDFFNLPPTDREGDPRIIYDGLSSRWIAVYLGFGVLDTHIYMAVSSTDDPTGNWCTSAIPGTGIFPIADQPAVGVTDDKVTVSVNFFEGEGAGALFDGEQTVVLQKSDMLSCTPTLGDAVFSPRPAPWGTTRPARNLSSGPDQYLAEFDWQSTDQLCIDKISGTPNANNVQRSTNCVTVLGQIGPPPDVGQPSGSLSNPDNDNRAQDAIWKNGDLWVSANTACQDNTFVRSCLHLIEVQTSDLQLLQDIVAGRSGFDAYYPAISLDANGHVIVSFTESGASEYPSAAIISRAPNDPLNTISNLEILKAGQQYYAGTRWGDYSSAALDPVQGTVWVGSEYSKATGGVGWGTWIAEISPPSGIDHVTVGVTGYDSPPLLYAIPPGLSVTADNSYYDIINVLHLVGTVTNHSSNTYDFVKACYDTYNSSGNVVTTGSWYTSPSTLGPNQTGTYDALDFDAFDFSWDHWEVWPDASYYH